MFLLFKYISEIRLLSLNLKLIEISLSLSINKFMLVFVSFNRLFSIANKVTALYIEPELIYMYPYLTANSLAIELFPVDA